MTCFPIESSSICSFSDFQTSSFALATWPQKPKMFRSLNQTLWEDNLSIDSYFPFHSDAAFGCGISPKTLPYALTFLCFRDVYYLSATCNPNRSLCHSICSSFQEALAQFFTDEAICKKDVRFKESRMKFLHETMDICKKSVKGDCIEATYLDQKSCGFGGDMKIAIEFCSSFPDHSCCQEVAQSLVAGKVKAFDGVLYTDIPPISEWIDLDNTQGYEETEDTLVFPWDEYASRYPFQAFILPPPPPPSLLFTAINRTILIITLSISLLFLGLIGIAICIRNRKRDKVARKIRGRRYDSIKEIDPLTSKRYIVVRLDG